MGLQDISQRIAQAEEAAQRPKGSVKLIAVSKVQPNERVEAVLAARPPLIWRKPGAGSCRKMARIPGDVRGY